MTTLKPRFNKKGNIKVGTNIWTFSKLYGKKIYNTEYGNIAGSCGDHCEGCEGSCYVKASYRYFTVIKGHARNTAAFRTDLELSFKELDGYIIRAKNKPDIIRIDQSGEIESTIELLNWCLLAKKHPEISFYIYTKNFTALNGCIKILDNGKKWSANFTVNISIWHEYGIKEYKKLCKHPFIKAFAYDDGYDYKKHNINIETYCTAYDKNGKMDHNITCDKCKKCIKSQFKVIGCFDH